MPKPGTHHRTSLQPKAEATQQEDTATALFLAATKNSTNEPLAISPVEQALFNSLFGPLLEHILAEPH